MAGGVVEGDLPVGVAGDQDQVAAGSRGIEFRAPDLLVHRCHDEPALVAFAGDPAGVEAGDDVSVEMVAVAGEVGELPVEQAGDPASGFFNVSAIVQAAVEGGEQAGGATVAGG